VRRPWLIRAAAASVLAAGVAAPLVRRRLKLRPAAVLGPAAAAPLALAVLVPRSRARDVAMCGLQMWAYLAAYEMPNDDPDKLRARVHVTYPLQFDKRIGFGTVPTVRLQRTFAKPGHFRRFEKVLVWSHWVWFMVPHGTMAYLLLRDREAFPMAAVRMYGTFDLGVSNYWLYPTAPPWYAHEHHLLDDGHTPELRRMMVEYGEQFWKSGWAPLYGALGGNPLAAMPSLHFATSVTAARLLRETGPVAGAIGWTYAITLGIALVYLGEHYVADLAAGWVLTEAVRVGAPRFTPLVDALSGVLQRLEHEAAVA
jgi:hypothetical protein